MALAQIAFDEAAIKSTVETLQRIYAVIIGLAITDALKQSVMERRDESGRKIRWNHGWALLSLLLLAIPFLHGMNAYLYDTYLLPAHRPMHYGKWLLFDFAVFSVEGCLFVLLSRALDLAERRMFYTGALVLLAVDVFWVFVIWCRTHHVITGWECVNGLVFLLLGAYLFFTRKKSGTVWSIVAMVIILLRTIADYWFEFPTYFPGT